MALLGLAAALWKGGPVHIWYIVLIFLPLVFAVGCAIYERRWARRLALMAPEERERALEKMSPELRQKILKILKDCRT
jgi:hypothetical protein